MSHLPTPRGVRTSVVVLATSLALAACGGDEPAASDPDETADSPGLATDEECSTAEEPAAQQAAGSGYVFDVPQGWDDTTAAMRQMLPQGDVAFADQSEAAGGLGGNVNVLVQEDTGLDDLDPVRDQFHDELSTLATEDVEVRDDREVGCAPAIQQSATGQQQGTELVFDQVAVLREGNLYVVTFTHAADDADDRQDAVDTVLDSWRWADAG